MFEIYELNQKPELFEEAITFFWRQWGNEHNYEFYRDCMLHSCSTTDEIPRFYIALIGQTLIGTYALIRNDLNSRQDLYPWVACVYIDPQYRGQEIGSKLLQHANFQAKMKGYKKLYLTTDLDGYYERYGWTHIGEAYGVSGGSIKLYEKSTE